MRILFSLLSLAAIVGCASEAPSPVATTAPVQVASAASAVATHQNCHKETTVGSNMPHTVCDDGSADINDLNVARNVGELNRTNGFQQGALSRGGVGH